MLIMSEINLILMNNTTMKIVMVDTKFPTVNSKMFVY